MPGTGPRARHRMISSAISRDRDVKALADEFSPFAALFYVLLITQGGDDAYLPTADPFELRMAVGPWFPVSDGDVEQWLKFMICKGLLERDGEKLQFPLETWYEHQSYIKLPNRRHFAPGAQTRANARNSADIRDDAREIPPPSSFPVTSPVPVSFPVPPTGDDARSRATPLADLDGAISLDELSEVVDVCLWTGVSKREREVVIDLVHRHGARAVIDLVADIRAGRWGGNLDKVNCRPSWIRDKELIQAWQGDQTRAPNGHHADPTEPDPFIPQPRPEPANT